jgi:chemotaxis protein CheD
VSAFAASRAASAAPARERVVHVVQGEHAVVCEPGIVLTTILGSCVATCLWDPIAGVGGMNHFLLPGDESGDSDSMKYGVNAMELLVNGLLQNGALRSRIQAKLFGGAHVIQNLSDIGAKNGQFAHRFLQLENIPCVGQSLGGDRARRIRFWPQTGRAAQMLLEATSPEALAAERVRAAAPAPASAAGSIELF